MLRNGGMAALLLGVGIGLAAPVGVAFAETSSTLTGCLDEQAGPQYVLREERELHLIALLEPVGFPPQNFARFLGHKVAVTGSRSTAAGGESVVKVRRIESLSDVCGAPPPRTGGEDESKLVAPGTTSGCLDEAPGPRYVLRGDHDLKLLMELEPDGFPVQDFARYLGHRVELSGRTYSRNDSTVMQVEQIKDLADRCVPD